MTPEERQQLMEQLKRQEGFELKPYKCTADKWSIGVGRNLEDNGISAEEAFVLLSNDLDRCERELDASFPWWRTMKKTRQSVFMNMLFNLGLPRFMGFKKMLAAAEVEDYDTAAKEMLDSRWAVQVGNRAEELALMMITGKWPT